MTYEQIKESAICARVNTRIAVGEVRRWAEYLDLVQSTCGEMGHIGTVECRACGATLTA